MQGDLAKVPLIEQQQAEDLLRAARLLDQSPTRQNQATSASRSAERQPYVSGRVNANVIEAFNDAAKIDDILTRNGYTIQQDKAIRPGGEHFSVNIRDNRSFHFNSNDPLNNGHWRSAFDAFCVLEQGGNVKQAVKAAAEQLGIPYQVRAEESKCKKDDLPTIQTNSRYLRQITADARWQRCTGRTNRQVYLFVRASWSELSRTNIITRKLKLLRISLYGAGWIG